MPAWIEFRKQSTSPADILIAAGIDDAPVKIMQVAKFMEVRVACGTSDCVVLTELDTSIPRAIIHIDCDMHRPRARFALAFGLACVMLGSEGKHSVKTFKEPMLTWALDLLIPDVWFEHYSEWLRWDMKSVARVFDLDRNAVKIRADRYG